MSRLRTKILSHWCFEIEKIIDKRMSELPADQFIETAIIINPYSDDWIEAIDNENPGELTEGEVTSCKGILTEHYALLKKGVQEEMDWYKTANFISKSFDISRLMTQHDFSIESSIYRAIHQELLDLFDKVIRASFGCFGEVLGKNDKWCVDDLIVLSDSAIIHRAGDQLVKKSPLERFKFLNNLNELLASYHTNNGDLDFISFKIQKGETQIKIEKREYLLQHWIYQTITSMTPEIEFKSPAQISILRKKIKLLGDLNHEYGGLIFSFDEMISVRCKIVKSSYKEIVRDFRVKEEITPNVKPATIIRHLVYGIQGFNSKYNDLENLKDLRIWISALFFNMRGFSYEDIRKSLVRKREVYGRMGNLVEKKKPEAVPEVRNFQKY